MSGEVISPNMNLAIPAVGVTSGPQYAIDINNCLTTIDAHDHSAGNGVQINPGGINISSDLPFNSNNATLLRTARFSPQSVTITPSTPDTSCLYVVNGNLYFNDTASHSIQITSGGAVTGTPGSIANLVSPASASYVSANSAFVFQSAANTSGYLDAASVILRNLVVNSKGLTLSPPNSMASDYSLTLPALPGISGKFLTIDTGGAISSTVGVDNSTLAVSGPALFVRSGGITSTQMASQSVVQDAIARRVANNNPGAGGFAQTGDITQTITSGSFTNIFGAAVTVTVVRNQVVIGLGQLSGAADSYVFLGASGGGVGSSSVTGYIRVLRNGSAISTSLYGGSNYQGGAGVGNYFPPSQLIIDDPGAGVWTYQLQGRVVISNFVSGHLDLAASLHGYEIK